MCIATIRPGASTTAADPFGFFGVPASFAPSSDDYQRNEVGVFYDETVMPDLVFHRVDLIPIRDTLCSHFKKETTMGKQAIADINSTFLATLYLITTC